MSTEIAAPSVSPLAAILSDPKRIAELDIDKLERLLSMQRQLDADAAQRQFNTAFRAVQAEMLRVPKRGVNSHTRSAYALAEDVYGMLDPIITAHGFSRSLSTEESTLADHMRFVLTVRHEAGHVEKHRMDAPIDNVGPGGKATKTKLHGMASSYTFCERHLVMKVFGVETGAVDDDGNAGAGIGVGAERITTQERAQIQAELDRTDSDIVRFCAWLGVDSLAAIRRGQLKVALSTLARKPDKRKPEPVADPKPVADADPDAHADWWGEQKS